jgi:pimeloyl-ACP methyl ester carboxylesterase/membrane protein DedA with SNARE-associated domain
MARSRLLRWTLFFLLFYAGLLAISTVVRFREHTRPDDGQVKRVEVNAVDDGRILEDKVSIAYHEISSKEVKGHPPVLFVHGSPGHGADFELVAPLLNGTHRVLAPDLPGFGRSTHAIRDYSIKAHAVYLLEFLDALKIERVHIIAFSMGGGVALNISEIAPQRIASITMLSAIGVQEMELLGDYHLNHLIHGVQLGFLYCLRELTPHFGYLDDAMLGVEYGRNFYDSDQRPLRDALKRYTGPMLIVHGKRDGLVPAEAAVEHHRIVPQSELVITELDHFMVFLEPQLVAQVVSEFLNRVDSGSAITRATAEMQRVEEASRPMPHGATPKAVGVTALVVFVLLATATLVSEDLACIGAGLMAAQGRASFLLVTLACFFGIFVGDVLLFLAGRLLGRAALRHAPLKWFIAPAAVESASLWFERRGAAVILMSRFIPGMRLATYFAAGVLNTTFWRFTLFFFVACLIWTPLLVGAAMIFGGELVKYFVVDEGNLLLRLGVVIVALYAVIKLAIGMVTHRGRRLLLSRWVRLTHWEFWPRWAFYPPVVIYVLFLALKHRSLTVFTLANPSIPTGGFIDESKSAILRGLAASNAVAPYTTIRGQCAIETRISDALGFLQSEGLTYPVVLKPDVGQRGDGVLIVKDEAELRGGLGRINGDAILQEFIGGEEYGVFYYRYPSEERGHVLAITDKRFPELTGDGIKTLEELILDDRRTVAMARFFFKQEAARLQSIPLSGEVVRLVELGTHCRGAIFLDGRKHMTAELEGAIDAVSQVYEGFYFGRYDIRVANVEDLRRGVNFKAIELNGVTSEATSIYDPQNSLRNAYKVLFQQWRIAFEIGKENRDRGLQPATFRELINAMRNYRRKRASNA